MKLALTTFVFCVAALLALGMVMLYSSSMAQVGASYLVKQLVAAALGLVLCITMAALDYRELKKFVVPLFVLAVLLLGMVFLPHLSSFLPCGIRNNGAARWIQLGNNSTLRFQPSEFAKLVLLMVLAWYGERFQRHMGTFKRGLLIPALLIGVVLALIVREPDVGNTLLLATVSGGVLLLGGLKLRYVLPPALAAVIAAGMFIYHANNAAPGSHLSMRSARVYSWLHLEETKQEKGMQAYQAMVALGSGGLFGKGLGDGRQKLGWIPEHHTDFIFSIIGEELGLIATLLVLAAFVTVVLCGIYIAYHASDTFGLLLGGGITFLIGLQAFINIGVVTSALPNKGLPLPFISYGPSNLMVMLLSIGCMLSIARQARPSEVVSADPLNRADFDERNPFKRRAQKSGARTPKAKFA
jgi:cell division protein FtsW